MASPQQEILLKEADSHVDKSQSRCDRATLTFADIWRSWWLLELLSVLVGIASIVALCALLKNRDGKAAPRTNVVAGVDITLNTIVAILSTVGRATLLLAVSECISQLKWTWYLNKHRPLEDLDTFDNASRGAWGGLVLLWKINIRQIASLGALLVVAGLAVDPLSQQLVHYDVRTVQGPSGSTSLLTAVSWSDSSTDTRDAFVQGEIAPDELHFPVNPSPPLPMKAAILNGLFSGNSTVDHLQPICTGGNCTYPSYRSLAICARSADVSPHLKSKNVSVPDSFDPSSTVDVTQWYLTNLNFLVDDSVSLFRMSSAAKKNPIKDDQLDSVTLDFSRSIAFKNSSAPIADVFMIYSTSRNSADASFAATELLLEWCVQNYTTTVINGTATTERHDAVSNFSTPDPGAIGVYRTMRPNDGDDRVYMLAPGTLYIFQNYFRSLLQGEANLTANGQLFVTNDATQSLFAPFNIFGEKVNGVSIAPDQGGGIEQIQKTLDNIAVGMTNIIRSQYNDTSSMIMMIESKDNPAIQGSTSLQETLVRIQWGWIAAPVALLIGSVLFVLAVIISSSNFGQRQKPEPWKSSSLPLLKALEPDLHQEGMSGMARPRNMEKWAKDVPVRLTRDADGNTWKLVRHWDQEKSGIQEDE